MTDDRNCVQGLFWQLQVQFHSFSQAQIALYQGAQSSFTDIQRHAARGLNSPRYQVASLVGMLNSARGYLRTGSLAYGGTPPAQCGPTLHSSWGRTRTCDSIQAMATSLSEAAGQAPPLACRSAFSAARYTSAAINSTSCSQFGVRTADHHPRRRSPGRHGSRPKAACCRQASGRKHTHRIAGHAVRCLADRGRS